MRLRKIANAESILEENGTLVKSEPFQYKGKWKSLFGNDFPIHIEVGMGKGQFIVGMAERNPDINYIGIEVVPSIMVRAVKKIQEKALSNVLLINVDASYLGEVFAKGEADRIYLNFSDPWPKSRHEKRRLTFKTFLAVFKEILVTDGEIHLKTDNEQFFEYSLQSMSRFPMEFTFVSLDLHKSSFQNNVMTEYEERFAALGQRIFRLEAKYR